MRPSLLLALAAMLLTHCSRKAIPSLPSVKTEDVSAPANAEVTVLSGSNLQDIADKTYGHESFSGFNDVFIIGKRIGLGFTYALTWAKSGHR